jgi:hypothetical protein
MLNSWNPYFLEKHTSSIYFTEYSRIILAITRQSLDFTQFYFEIDQRSRNTDTASGTGIRAFNWSMMRERKRHASNSASTNLLSYISIDILERQPNKPSTKQ